LIILRLELNLYEKNTSTPYFYYMHVKLLPEKNT
jgi:hypothetical protein